MKTEWICTDPDNEQYGRQLSQYEFEFYEGDYKDVIDLSEYTFAEIERHISSYYKDLKEVYDIYPESALWIMAECIFEQESELY